jgi:alpha-tubulin suppressor-like RCC1 family protein
VGTSESLIEPDSEAILLPPVASFDVGGHTCAVTTVGAAYCWGDNSLGQLGIDSHVQNKYHPERVVDHY